MGVRGCYDGVPLVINRLVCPGPKSSGMLSIENFLYLIHISNIRRLKANFCGRKKEGDFHYKNF